MGVMVPWKGDFFCLDHCYLSSVFLFFFIYFFDQKVEIKI